jgi:hypothetical protein
MTYEIDALGQLDPISGIVTGVLSAAPGIIAELKKKEPDFPEEYVMPIMALQHPGYRLMVIQAIMKASGKPAKTRAAVTELKRVTPWDVRLTADETAAATKAQTQEAALNRELALNIAKVQTAGKTSGPNWLLIGIGGVALLGVILTAAVAFRRR